MTHKQQMPEASHRLRVNMGWQCPECHGANVFHLRRSNYECEDCGCRWDRRYYPSLVVRDAGEL